MNYRQLKKAVKDYFKSLHLNKRGAIIERGGICILSLNYFFKIFHCLDCDGFIIQELYDGSWRIYYSEPGREYETTLFLSNNESEACEEFLRIIKERIH